jgi:hypothetical protein
MLVPLYGFLKGDALGLLVLVHDNETVRDIGHRLQQAATTRIAPRPHARVYHEGRLLPPELAIAEAGLRALDRVDVVPEDG